MKKLLSLAKRYRYRYLDYHENIHPLFLRQYLNYQGNHEEQPTLLLHVPRATATWVINSHSSSLFVSNFLGCGEERYLLHYLNITKKIHFHLLITVLRLLEYHEEETPLIKRQIMLHPMIRKWKTVVLQLLRGEDVGLHNGIQQTHMLT